MGEQANPFELDEEGDQLGKDQIISNQQEDVIDSEDRQWRIEKLEQTSPTISSGIIAPASTPTKVGDFYVDTVANKLYVATGTSSSSDWTILN